MTIFIFKMNAFCIFMLFPSFSCPLFSVDPPL